MDRVSHDPTPERPPTSGPARRQPRRFRYARRVISPIHRTLSAAGLTLAASRLARVG